TGDAVPIWCGARSPWLQSRSGVSDEGGPCDAARWNAWAHPWTCAEDAPGGALFLALDRWRPLLAEHAICPKSRSWFRLDRNEDVFRRSWVAGLRRSKRSPVSKRTGRTTQNAARSSIRQPGLSTSA